MPSDEEPFGLRLQRLGSDTERTLVAAHVVGLRNGNHRFSTSDVVDLFDRLHVPAPTNTSARLGNLRSKKHVVRNKDQTWGLTPEGRVAAVSLMGGIDASAIEAEAAEAPGAELGNVRHSVIAPTFAPQQWVEPIGRLLVDSPFERNVFLMTRYPNPEDADDPLNKIIPAIRSAVEEHGLLLHTADNKQLDDSLLSNVAAYMWACQYGIGLLEDRVRKGLNYNVVIELGAMIVTGRRCALIRDSKTAPAMPTDLVGQIYKGIDFGSINKVVEAVHGWLADDLGLGKCPSC